MVVFQVLDPIERNFDYSGPVVFKSLESSELEVLTETEEIQEEYLQLMGEFIDDYKAGFMNSDIEYYLVTTDTPIELCLWSFLAGRKK